MPTPLRLAVILGAARHVQFRDRVAHWVGRQLQNHDELVPYRIDCTWLTSASRQPPTAREIAASLDTADGFLVITPAYNHGDPAMLERLLDSVTAPWAAKPAGFIGYGGPSGGSEDVARLQALFTERQALALPQPLLCTNAYGRFGLHGELYASLGEPQRLATLLARLTWWSRAINAAQRAELDSRGGRTSATSA